MKVYLAGPEVFLNKEHFDIITNKKKSILKAYDFEGVSPLDNQLNFANCPTKMEVARNIYNANQDLMNKCDAVIANLTPFRGKSADTGTVFEVGYMLGQNKIALGFTCTKVDYFDRYSENGETHDYKNMLIEDFGCLENLMVDCGIEKSGGVFVACDDEIFNEKAFTECVGRLKELEEEKMIEEFNKGLNSVYVDTTGMGHKEAVEFIKKEARMMRELRKES